MNALADALNDVLATDGACPRRAVVVDGRLADRATHPDAPEIDVLSRLCELARSARGEPSYPRHTTGLLEHALATNDPGAWAAAADDLDTRDFDVGAAVGVLGQRSKPASFVSCLVQARDARHAVDALRVFSAVASVLPSDTKDLVGEAVGCQVRALVDALVRHGGTLRREVRETVYAEFGKMIAAASVPRATMADVLHSAVSKRLYDVLRVFLPTSVGSYVRPETFELAIERVGAAPALQRHAMTSIVAKAVRENPTLAIGRESKLASMLTQCAGSMIAAGDMDIRGCLALSVVAQAAVANPASEVVTSLACMLEHACAHIVQSNGC